MVNAEGHPYNITVDVNGRPVTTLPSDRSRWCTVPQPTGGTCNNLAHYSVAHQDFCRRHAGQTLLAMVINNELQEASPTR